MTIEQAKRIDRYGKGGALVDGVLVREFPDQNVVKSRRRLA